MTKAKKTKKAVKKKAKTTKKSRTRCKSYDIVSVGSATVDVFAKTESELIKIKTLRSEEELIAYPSGSKILITEVDFLFGGGGTNTAVSFSRLGLNAAYLGKVGQDENGHKILKHLRKEKVDFVGKHGRDISGYSIILDSIEEDRTILAFKGANDKLKYSELTCSSFNTPWYYFSSMVGESYKTLEKLAAYAERKKAKIAFNPSNYLAEKGMSALKKVLSKTYALILNDEEAKLLVGVGTPEDHLTALHNAGPEIVVITMGKHGAIASDRKHIYSIKPPKVKVHETTGAGDAFAAGFVAGLVKKKHIEFALHLGAINAAGCVSQYGSHVGLPTWKEAHKMLRKLKVKVTKKAIKKV
jgi:ribokinase